MNKKLLIIKLGGAVVTYKRSLRAYTRKDSPIPKARISTIKTLSKEIKQVSDKGYQIILVHGAGYVHSPVKNYNLQYGMKTGQQELVFAQVNNSLQQLNSIIIQYLLRAKLKAVSIPPHTFITQSNGELKDIDVRIIKNYLEKDFVPVLFANMVLDDKWGCSVLSGDTIVCYLSQKLRADKVIFLSDVDGIYDSDPKKNPAAKLIPEVNNKNLQKVLKGLTQNNQNDISGEMFGKLQSLNKIKLQSAAVIANGLKPNSLLKTILSSDFGTKIYL